MGRPRKIDGEKKVAQLNLHLTAEEERKILEYAAASGMVAPEWARKKIFTGNFPPIKLSPIETSLYQELRKIGVNLNQGTHKLNQGDIPKDYLLIQMDLLSLLNRIYKVLLDDRQSDKR